MANIHHGGWGEIESDRAIRSLLKDELLEGLERSALAGFYFYWNDRLIQLNDEIDLRVFGAPLAEPVCQEGARISPSQEWDVLGDELLGDLSFIDKLPSFQHFRGYLPNAANEINQAAIEEKRFENSIIDGGAQWRP